jgi:hypothetical protein
MFMALLLMYLREIRSILNLIRFLKANPEWSKILGLKRRNNGVEVYSVPDEPDSTGSLDGLDSRR